MTPDRWRRIEELYNAARDRGPEAFAGVDPELRAEVERMLSQKSGGQTLDRLAGDMVTELTLTMVAIGSQLGPYRIEALLGKGGMGEVFRALDTKLNRPVAIKFLSSHIADDPARRRFQREARMVSSLNHPHILTVHDAGEYQGKQYLVTEFVDGGTLKDWAKSEKRSWRDIVELLTGVADGLAAAHATGIAHRDVKPANILVAKNGYAKLADFGLAKLMAAPPADGTTTVEAEATRPGMIVGTVAYMSAEQASGGTIDARSDIFSFGVVLYEQLEGRRPFDGATDLETLQKIIHGTAPPLKGEAPVALRAVVQKALEKNPADRYQSMREMVIDLRRLRRDGSAAEPERAASIAVLPFTDMSAARDQDWFCDGIAEEILTALMSLRGLKVAARTSAFSLKGKGHDLRTIGERLNVTTVLEGSVRRAGDRVRITAQLSDVQNGYQLWSERYDRELKDIFDVQDEIAKAIAERLRVTLAGVKGDRLVDQATPYVEAYQLYLKGRALLARRGTNISSALKQFRRAVEVDPQYSLAWAGLADALTGLAITGSMSTSESKAQALAAATRSVELDRGSAAAHSALACATLMYENNRTKAGREFERALELNPNYVLGRGWYALFYLQWACGRLEQGIAEARRALDADPQSSYLSVILACCLCTAGRLDEAIATARRSVEQDRESFVARWILGVSLAESGRSEEAVSVLEVATGMSGRHVRALTSLAEVYGQWGKLESADAVHRELMERCTRSYVPATYLALTAEASGKHEEALAFARRAWEDREVPLNLHARHFTEFRGLRSDARFAAIIQEMDSFE